MDLKKSSDQLASFLSIEAGGARVMSICTMGAKLSLTERPEVVCILPEVGREPFSLRTDSSHRLPFCWVKVKVAVSPRGVQL